MRKRYSIAQARDHLPGIVHEVERGTEIELTRRGKLVAVLVSVEQYERLTGIHLPRSSIGFGEALAKFRREHEHELEELWKDGDPFEGIRDRTPSEGRDYEPQTTPRKDFWEEYERFRREVDIPSLQITPDIFPPPRDPSPGREFSW